VLTRGGRAVGALGVSGVGLVLCASVAVADGGWGAVDCAQFPVAGCDLRVGDAGGDPGGDAGGGGGSVAECEVGPSWWPAQAVQEGRAGTWVWVYCPGGDTRFPILVPDAEAGAAAPVLSAVEVARVARARLLLPVPLIAANPAGEQLVNLATWLWLSSGWAPMSATVSVPGVSVTATARPRLVVWSMGDGAVVTCIGPGTPFNTGRDPAAASPDCGHTYRRSSAGQVGQAFSVSATVHWTVTWSGAGQSGTFPDLTTTAITALRVAESQALNNGG